MPTVLNTLNIVPLSPPTILPTIYITVKVGETLPITRALIDSSLIYVQPQGFGIGRLNIVSHEVNYNFLLSQTNNSQTIAYFTNLLDRIYRPGNVGNVINGNVLKNTIDSDRFYVTGVKIGQAAVVYRATATDGSIDSAETTSVLGRIVVNVVTNVNNHPSSLSGGLQDVVYGSTTTIKGLTVTTNYSDPEGDAPYKVKVTQLPTKGKLIFQGVDVVVNQEILYSQIQSGMLVYWNDQNLSVINSTDVFRSTVSDTGSEQYF